MNLLVLISYALIFWILRLVLVPDGLVNDEARQFIDATSFDLGYAKQAPLFTWLIWGTVKLFGFKIYLISLWMHIFIFGIYWAMYKAFSFMLKPRSALLASFSVLFVPLFSYQFYRYMVHSALMSAIAALAIALFVYILSLASNQSNAQTRIWAYGAFGLLLGLGILAKYNFIFFLGVLVLACLCSALGRAVLLRFETLISFLTGALVCLPHLLWLQGNDFPPLNYALGQAKLGALLENLSISYFANTYLHLFVFLIIFMIFFASKLRAAMELANENPFLHLMRMIFVLCLASPLVLTLVLQSGFFTARWLAAIELLFIFSCFALISSQLEGGELFDKFESKKQIYAGLLMAIVLTTFGLKTATYAFPGSIELFVTSRPYKALAHELTDKFAELGLNIKDQKIYSFRDVNLLAGLKAQIPNLQIALIESKSDAAKVQGQSFVIWDLNQMSRQKMDRRLTKFAIGSDFRYIGDIELLYKNSKDLYFQLGLAMI